MEIALLIVIGAVVVGLVLSRLICGPLPHKAFCPCEDCLREADERETRYQEWTRLRHERNTPRRP